MVIDLNNIMKIGADCCGCGACEQLCPKNCITLKYDGEGFLYPHIDESLCVECGLCLNRCPISSEAERGKNASVYAAKYSCADSVFKSTSGGIFIPLALNILEQDGAVFGCAYDENLVAKHILVENKGELYKLQSSKYVQSDTRGVYSSVKKELDSGRKVLFSGTGCQVAGLKTFLNKDYGNLFTADIVCHGVPSPKLFEKYTEYMGKKLGGKLTEYNFRSKEKRGWDLYYKAANGKKSKSDYGFFDPYYNAFLVGKTYRESCYNCKFANAERCGDITLADYWGIEKMHPEFSVDNGVSLVLINSEKGRALWESISDSVNYIPSTIEKAAVMNKNLSAPSARPDCRDTIYDGYDGDFELYLKTKLAFRINPKTKIKKMIPLSVKKALKSIKK